ncbi:TetR/AcrR family transcriptional regulator [Campylobacter sp. 19-13652]|uniref:TetR/AcrR family transcriptional regulator n=1 Tax=Campylobacter sp. 19-13652 TaxID=2840180 RepID=UPI001C78A25A|nr:TetR/AcrR family transcriptional regulator [Campylobacter sp. 19-13652]BCX80145.1 TetR family transcriptional regulator [Campylobacter sp. 19-13652]
MTKQERESIKRSRMMKYFIDAANEIINRDGVSSVTIRNAASLAGYSSATLYNYFDNLTHLIFLSILDQLDEYNKALKKAISKSSNSLEVYMQVCACFCEYAYAKPEIYWLLFFAHGEGKFDAYLKQYYEIFPDKIAKASPLFLDKMFHSNNIYDRSFFMLERCVNDGYLQAGLVNDFNDICLRFNKTILQDVKDGILSQDDATKMTMRYYHQLLNFYATDDGRVMLNRCCKEYAGIKI